MPPEKTVIVKNARKILRFFSRYQTDFPLLIMTHDYPDPDTIASAYALSYLCEYFNIPSRMVYGGIIGRMENRAMVQLLKIPVHKIKHSDFKKYSRYALLDTQPCFENNSFPSVLRATLVIDQHPYVKKPEADLAIVDPECGATSVILAHCLFQAKIKIPQRVATALAYGILADTLNLYREGKPEIVNTYQALLPFCDIRTLAKIQNPSRSRKFFATLGKAIQSAMVRRGLIISHLGQVESPDLVAQTADFLLTYRGMQRSFCTGRYKNKLHVSLRMASTNCEAGQILRDIFSDQGEAGGHGSIGGGSFHVTSFDDDAKWKEAENQLTERILKRLRIPAKGEFYFPFR